MLSLLFCLSILSFIVYIIILLCDVLHLDLHGHLSAFKGLAQVGYMGLATLGSAFHNSLKGSRSLLIPKAAHAGLKMMLVLLQISAS